jgi:hypothetical protein
LFPTVYPSMEDKSYVRQRAWEHPPPQETSRILKGLGLVCVGQNWNH